MTLTLSRDALADILDRAHLDNDVVITRYQGRGMGAYFPGDTGRYAFAIVGGLDTLVGFTLAAGQVLDNAHDLFSNPTTDALGRDSVYYWSHVELEVPGLGSSLYGDEDEIDVEQMDRLDRVGQ